MDTHFGAVRRRRAPAEDLSQLPEARLDIGEWDIRCSTESCDAILADASWLDIQMVMLQNSPDDTTAREAMRHLPDRRFRAYRMNVRFAPGWKRTATDGVWVHHPDDGVMRSGKEAARQRRLIRGEDTMIDLRQEAETPVKAKCPSCALLQVIPGHRRKGLPGTPGPASVGPGPDHHLRRAG